MQPYAGVERAYTHFHLDSATGRPSSYSENMQNIPPKKKDSRNFRGMFLPDNGIWTDMDNSQVELRELGYLSGDREMNYIFSLPLYLPDGSKNIDADIHQQTANATAVDRNKAKNGNFAFVYGATEQTLMETLGTNDLQAVREWTGLWSIKFPQAWDWIHDVQEFGVNHGYVTTMMGRKLRIPNEFEESEDGRKRKAVNYGIQGSAAEVLIKQLIAVKDRTLSLQVHDQILFDGYIDTSELRFLEDVTPLHIPIEVNYVARWE
jgi:DNA polymerase I-like protein with 3'-5' exonuclease and polymerase domains